jgi:hypothetical protein
MMNGNLGTLFVRSTQMHMTKHCAKLAWANEHNNEHGKGHLEGERATPKVKL